MATRRLQKAFGIGALVLTLGLTGCERGITTTNKQEPRTTKIKVSDYGVVYNRAIVYNGMNNEKTFSISFLSREAVNTYYPSDSKEIEFCDEKFKVIEVTPEHIILGYLGESTKK